MSLPPTIVKQWDAYLAQERRGTRPLALVRLGAFIESLRGQSETDWQNWAVELSEMII